MDSLTATLVGLIMTLCALLVMSVVAKIWREEGKVRKTIFIMVGTAMILSIALIVGILVFLPQSK